MILYHAESGYFYWSFAPVPKTQLTPRMTSAFERVARAHVATGKLVLISIAYTDLIVSESIGKANSIDDAENKAFQEAPSRVAAFEANPRTGLLIISIWKVLPRDFFIAPGHAQAGPVNMLDLTHKGNTWEVTIEGQWKEKITLNEKYELTGHARVN